MTTTVTYTIGPAETYQRLSDAIDNAYGLYPDLTVSDVALVFEVKAGLTLDENINSLKDFVTDSTRNIVIKAYPGDEGVASLSVSDINANGAIDLASNTTFQDLVINDSNSRDNCNTIQVSLKSNSVIKRCKFFRSTELTSSRSVVNNNNSGNIVIENCLAVYSFAGGTENAAVFRTNDFKGSAELYKNCTFINLNGGPAAFLPNGSSDIFRNNVFYTIGATALSGSGFNAAESSHNAFLGAGGFGQNQVTITSAAFNDFANGDYTPATGGALELAGANLNVANEPAGTDVTGALRVYWDIGAFASDKGKGVGVGHTMTIPAANVDATAANFPVYLDLAQMPSQFWDAVRAGDGTADSLRVFVPNSGNYVEKPREIVSADSTIGSESGEVHLLTDTVAGQDAEVILYADGTSADYAVTDAFGRNAVWADYEFVSHDGGGLDSSGNVTTTANGGVTAGDTTGQMGSATAFDGVDDYFSVPISVVSSVQSNNTVTFQGWAKLNSLAADGALLGHFNSSSPNTRNLLYYDVGGGGDCWRFGGGSVFTSTSASGAAASWQHVVGTTNGSQSSVYTNGSLIDTNIGTPDMSNVVGFWNFWVKTF